MGYVGSLNIAELFPKSKKCIGAIMHKLLAIVEVDKESRVICQAEGCGRHVYKRIHVVLDEGEVSVLGQQCYSNIYLGGMDSANTYSHYTGAESRKLTPEEIALLISNTQWLIEQFENELAIRLQQEQLLREEHDRQQNIEAERRRSEQAAREAAAQNALLRDVKCHYCRRPMTTRARTVPAVGYKCELCLQHNRPMPGKTRMGVITAEDNARANDLEKSRSEQEKNQYKNIRG